MNRTVLYEVHVSLGAKMVEFAGWQMPLHYPTGIVEEHLQTRKQAGLFDVSHMGRFVFQGRQALSFLQHVLTNNAAGLETGKAQYTMIANDQGGAIDDAYLYRFDPQQYLLVVNAGNREKDWRHLQRLAASFTDLECQDITEELALLSLQGPLSKQMVSQLIEKTEMPEPARNSLSVADLEETRVLVARTGYTGEPLGFELFIPSLKAEALWHRLVDLGAVPAGLGARDSLRLEAGLPLYGHELGRDPDGREIPIYASPLARFAVSFSPLKQDFIGKSALRRQFAAYRRIVHADYAELSDLPRVTRLLALRGRRIARAGTVVFSGQRQRAGWVTSGTMVPYWQTRGSGLDHFLTDQRGLRAVCLALIDAHIEEGDPVSVEIRGRRVAAELVPFHLRSEAPPYSRAIIYHEEAAEQIAAPAGAQEQTEKRAGWSVQQLLSEAIENTRWRQQRCINLIPSEQTQSPMVRLLSVMDPSFRYAEHRRIKALNDAQVFYYQGTDFIARVEELLEEQIRIFLGCCQVETRVVSGQMANTVVFSALVDYLNRADRRGEPRRIGSVMNNHIIKGGHLSAQPMGALRDFIARDPLTEKPAVVNFPVCADNAYKIDVAQVRELLERHRPELIILGKSMMLHREPVAEIRAFLDELELPALLMYDMAHVLGLAGPLFQEPFREGADIVTGSTHKTFFGTQRGIIAGNCSEDERSYLYWEALERRTFPGSVSNHHLGTLLGLLMAAYEMNAFREEYQRRVLGNAKALAAALKDTGMDVAGDPGIGFTETHQVIVNVGYGGGVEAARKLEQNSIVVNYQAAPEEEGFTASGSLRLGVAEMTRFGMAAEDFATVAQFIHDVVVAGQNVQREVAAFRKRYQDLLFCFSGREFEDKLSELHRLI